MSKRGAGVDISSQAPPVDRDEMMYRKLQEIHAVAVRANETSAANRIKIDDGDKRARRMEKALELLASSNAEILGHVARGAERDADVSGRVHSLELRAQMAGADAGTEAGAASGKAAGKKAGSTAGLIAGPAVVTVAAVLWELGKLVYKAISAHS